MQFVQVVAKSSILTEKAAPKAKAKSAPKVKAAVADKIVVGALADKFKTVLEISDYEGMSSIKFIKFIKLFNWYHLLFCGETGSDDDEEVIVKPPSRTQRQLLSSCRRSYIDWSLVMSLDFVFSLLFDFLFDCFICSGTRKVISYSESEESDEEEESEEVVSEEDEESDYEEKPKRGRAKAPAPRRAAAKPVAKGRGKAKAVPAPAPVDVASDYSDVRVCTTPTAYTHQPLTSH